MKEAIHTLLIPATGQAPRDIAKPISAWIGQQDYGTGLVTVWCRNPSASLIVRANADSAVQAGLLDFFRRTVPEGRRCRHGTEGPDDMPARIKVTLTQTGLSIPIPNTAPTLGIWQAIYLFEHRSEPQNRSVVMHLLGA